VQRWFIDLTVWVGTILVLGLISFGIFEQMRPPTGAELAARERQRISDICYAQPETKQFPDIMRNDYCRCVVDAALGFGGASDGDLLACRQRAARSMSSDAALATTFGARFPAACAGLESGFAGRKVAEGTDFCQCLQTRIGSDRGRMAMYAFAGSEPDSPTRKDTYRSCASSIAYGSGWKFGYSAKGTEATIDLPPVTDARMLRFDCLDGTLSFAATRFNGDAVSDEVWFEDDTGEVIKTIGPDGAVLRLAEQLSFIDENSDTWKRLDLRIGDHGYALTLEGARDALAPLLKSCGTGPRPSPTPVADSAVPDRWEQISSSRAVTKAEGDNDAYLDVVCDQPPSYLAISPVTVPDLSRYADPEGTFEAIDVPVRITAGSQNFDLKVPCDSGSEGAELSCYVTLDKPLMMAMLTARQTTVALDGTTYPAVATFSSTAFASIGPACLRSVSN
jgi:hypothetical protein